MIERKLEISKLKIKNPFFNKIKLSGIFSGYFLLVRKYDEKQRRNSLVEGNIYPASATSANATRFPHYTVYVTATVTNRYSKTPLVRF